MPWIAKFNETGTHAKGIFKRVPTEEERKDPIKLASIPRDHYIKVRIDLYPAKGTKTYIQQYVDETVWDEKRQQHVFTGKKKLNPCLCHFIKIDPETTRDQLEAYVRSIFDESTRASLDIALASSNLNAVSAIMKSKAGFGSPQTKYRDYLIGDFLTPDDVKVLDDARQRKATPQDEQELIQRAEQRLKAACQPLVYQALNDRFLGLEIELPDIETAIAQKGNKQIAHIWRVAVVINFPRHLPVTSPPYPGQQIKAVSRIPQGSSLNSGGVFVTIQPWPNVKIPSLPYGPSGIQDEPAALVFYVTGEYLEAMSRTRGLIEPLLDSLSFQLQTAIHAYELQVLDMTPPISIGMERDLFVSKYFSGKFIPAFPPTNVNTLLHPQLDLSLEKASPRTRAALRWYIKGLATIYEVDKFVFFWTALEILRSQSKVSVVSPYKARCGHEIPTCPTCGKATSKEILGQSMKKFLVEKANTTQETANKLWQFRQIVHGAKDLTYEDMRDLPIMTNSLRQALVVLLKSALGWPLDQPPSNLPVGSGIITSHVINSKHTLDPADIESAIQGSDFFGSKGK
jgi:hypothetical protein